MKHSLYRTGDVQSKSAQTVPGSPGNDVMIRKDRMRYIRAIHLEYPATSNQHISQIRFSTTPTGSMSTETRASVVRNIENRWQNYFWYSDRSGNEGRVITGSTDWGTKCIATAHETAAADLLSLPRF